MIVKIITSVVVIVAIVLLFLLIVKSFLDMARTLNWSVGDRFKWTYMNNDFEVWEITAIDYDKERVILKTDDGHRFYVTFESFQEYLESSKLNRI